MKSRIRSVIAALASAIGFTSAAAAATPVAVWDGDFDEATKGDYTLTAGTGHEIAADGSTITIGDSATVGVKVSGGDVYTIVVKARGCTPTSTDKPEVIAAMLKGDNAYMGLGSKSDKKGWYLWDNGAWGASHVTSSAIINDAYSHKYTVSYTYDAAGSLSRGTTLFMDGVQLAAEAGLRGSALAKATSATIGGHQSGSNLKVARGLVIEGVAIFDSTVSTAAASAYMFPSEKAGSDYKSVLSLNFGESSYNVSDETDPGAIVDDSNWYNLNGNNITDAQAGTAFVSYGGSGNWRNTGKVAQYLKSYIDDNGKANNISITNLTGAAYDVYIYCSSDNATGWPYKTVNGVDYCALADGEATLGTESWGYNTYGLAMLGANVMVIRSVVPGEDGSITITSARNGSYRGSIAAIQLGEVETAIPKAFSLELTESTDWSAADWAPELPQGGMPPDAVATVTASGNPTLTLDGTITVGKLVIKSEADNMLAVKKNSGANTSIGSLDVSAATDGVTFDSREGFTACRALLTTARTVDNKFYFLGEGENGATLDYGTAAYDNNTIQGHYIFEGGVHTFQKVSESAGLLFGANADFDNPTFWVTDGATLNFKARNPCGWNADASTAGIIRIGNGAKVVPMNADASAGTWYWSQQFYLEDGATLEIGTTGDNFRTVGNNAEAPHFKVPEGATAEITGGDGNCLALPSDNGGAAVFDVAADATLTVSAKLKTLADGRPLVKYGEGALALAGDASAFNGAIQVKAGTLEGAALTALGGSATVAVDEGATLSLNYESKYRAYPTAVSGSGNVVKTGWGMLGVTPGQFGDNKVAVEDGRLRFTITHAQAIAPGGTVLCKAATDISEYVTVVNEAGREITGDFTFEESTLSFKANCVDVYLEFDGSVASWSQLVEGKGWINSLESTITITNTYEDAMTFRFDEEITAKSLKIVGTTSDGQFGISYEDFATMTIGSYDFSEAVSTEGGIAIYCEDAPENTETRIITGATITGFENVVPLDGDVPEGTGFYADDSNIWLCKTIEDVTRTSPTTEDVQAYTNFFVGVESSEWEEKANWRTAKDGLLVPYQYAKYPQSPEAQNPNWFPACFDGDIIDAYEGTKEITCETVEGWETKLDFRNGVNVTIERLKKFANHFMWIDEDSSVTIGSLGGSAFQYGYVFNVAGQLAIGAFDAGVTGIPYAYNLGEVAVVTYADGVKTGTHAINGGKLVVEGDGIAAPVSVTNSVAITTPALAAVTINQDSTLTLTSTAEGDLAIGGNWTNSGTLDVAAGTVVFKPGVTPGDYTTSGTGKVIIGQQVAINDCGKIAVEGETADDVRLFDIGGNPVAVSKVEGGYAYYEWDVTGKNCWWDYEFEGNLKSTGTDTTTMSAEGQPNPYNEGDTALRVGYGTPYRGATYPENFTAVVYGKMVNNAGHMEIGFGSTTGGTKYGVVFACGDPAKSEVKLHVTSGYSILETVTMKVTDAYDSNHLYAFTCQTVDDGTEKTKVSIYLDGKFLQAYTFAGKVTLGSGFQVGSIHGGGLGGCTKATTANDHAELDFLRVYQTVLTAEAMTKYAEKYPYESKNGSSERAFAGDADWTAAEGTPWTVTPFGEESYATNSALAGSVVEITATAAAEVAMNLAEATTYESLTIGAGESVALKAGDDAVAPSITAAEIDADTTVDYNAVSFGTVAVASGKTLTFDFTDYPFATHFADATIAFTGATSGEGAIAAKGLPTAGARTATFEKNASTDQYELKITVAPAPFVFTVAEGAEGEWTWNGETVTEAIVDANPAFAIEKEGTGTLEKALVNNRSYVVNGGTLKAANAKDVAATVTVNADGTFDFNGKADSYATINLNGGKLVNDGGEMGTGSRQMNGIALTADSTVGGTGDFGLISGGYAENTLALGGATLTKEGENTFFLCDSTVTNGAVVVREGTLKTVGTNDDGTEFVEATLALEEGTTLEIAAPLSISAITASGATIDNAKTVGNFTLDGTATLTGNGTWGTNTLASGAVVNVGEKRDLVFAGAGKVNVTLTAAEYEAGQATLFVQAEGGASAVGTVLFQDEDITDKCTISGNAITAIRKQVPPAEYKESFDDAQSATNKMEAVNANIGQHVRAPDGAETTADYLVLFGAKVTWNGSTGKYDVTIALTDQARVDLRAAADAQVRAVAAGLIDTAVAEVTVTTVPGLYYAVVGGTEAAALDTPGAKTLATSDSTELPKPELNVTDGKAFYAIQVSDR